MIDKTLRQPKSDKWVFNFEAIFGDPLYGDFLKYEKKENTFNHPIMKADLYVTYAKNKNGVVTKGFVKTEMEFILLEWDVYYEGETVIHIIKDEFKIILNNKNEIIEKHPPEAGVFGGAKHPLKLITFIESKENISLLGNKLDQYKIWKNKE